MFNYIDVDNWERKEHFNYYRNIIKCGYSCTVQLDIGRFRNEVKEKGLRFYPSFVYCVSKIVNSMKEFRMAVDSEGKPGYYDISNPNMTIFHSDDNTFSDMWTEYYPDFRTFYDNVISNIEICKDKKGIKVRDNQPPNFFCISCVPWINFTSYSTSVPGGEPNMFPIITFGKYEEQDGKLMMPFAINIAHSCADGYHTGKFINDLQKLLDTIEL